MASVILSEIGKSYKNGFHAVMDFNLEIQDGEFIIFVGPSGCGKSTTLRMIAGLEEITSGELWIDGKLVNFLEPQKRELSMVFQNYALYPYMSVYENIAFALRCARLDKAEIDARVREAAKLLEIDHLLERKPNALSGGQKQRVAIGSVLAKKPKLILMDEPLSNLDAKLRSQMRVELAKLQKQSEATIIYVTHDQVEAMTLGSRIVVMKEGVIQQVAAPMELYNNPVNQFVAGFIGSPAMNFLPVEVKMDHGHMVLESGENRLAISRILEYRLAERGYAGKKLMLGIRPEDIHEDGGEDCRMAMEVDVREGLGAEVLLHGQVTGEPVCAKLPPDTRAKQGKVVWLYPDMTHAMFFDSDTGENILYVEGKQLRT